MPPLEGLGPELVVLTTGDIRLAERAQAPGVVETGDGPVRAQAGDFIVAMPSGERYPVHPAVYFGSYELISTVGPWHVGRRLLHPRRAWPVRAAAVEFDYGNGRGVVSAPQGAWVYQSADDDFGVIAEAAQPVSYVVVGTQAELARHHWHERFARLSALLIAVPPVLIGLSLLALMWPALHTPLLLLEALLLLVGAAAAFWSRHRQWALKAAVTVGQTLARDFQVVVRALHLPVSDRFPALALWRAAQEAAQGRDSAKPSDADLLREVKSLIDRTVDRLRTEVQAHKRATRLVKAMPWVLAAVMLVCVPALLLTHHLGLKLFVMIWLPALLGAAQAWHTHGQREQRALAAAELQHVLLFAKRRLVASAQPASPAALEEEAAVLRLLCLCVAQYTQRELAMAAAEEVHVPV